MTNELLERTAAASVVGLLAGASMGAALAAPTPADAAPASAPDALATAAAPVQEARLATAAAVAPERVEGRFSFEQGVVTPVAQIARDLGGASKVLCGTGEGVAASGEQVVGDALDWVVTVTGDGVNNPLSATLGELAETGTQSTVMGCSCLGNPADGRASVNAGCTGVSLALIFDAVGLREGANAVTFVSADGFEVALPLSYVRQRAALLVYQINGEPLANSVGGVNQLWLGSTAARYFASDVVEIRVTCEAEPPLAPGAAEAGANLPNVGVAEGREV